MSFNFKNKILNLIEYKWLIVTKNNLEVWKIENFLLFLNHHYSFIANLTPKVQCSLGLTGISQVKIWKGSNAIFFCSNLTSKVMILRVNFGHIFLSNYTLKRRENCQKRIFLWFPLIISKTFLISAHNRHTNKKRASVKDALNYWK